MHGAGGFGIEREFKLFIPIKKETSIGKGVIAVARSRSMPGDISGMRGDFVGQNALLHVFGVRQPEMLLRRDVTQHGSAVPPDHSRANGASNVVVARRDIDHERAK